MGWYTCPQGRWWLDACRPLLLWFALIGLLSYQLGASPASRLLAWLPGSLHREEESLPLAGAAAWSIPGTRSICCCSHCSSWEHANCPLQSWTAVSCQREIMDPFSAGERPFRSCQLNGPRRNGGREVYLHPDPHWEGKLAQPCEEAGHPPERHHPQNHRQQLFLTVPLDSTACMMATGTVGSSRSSNGGCLIEWKA